MASGPPGVGAATTVELPTTELPETSAPGGSGPSFRESAVSVRSGGDREMVPTTLTTHFSETTTTTETETPDDPVANKIQGLIKELEGIHSRRKGKSKYNTEYSQLVGGDPNSVNRKSAFLDSINDIEKNVTKLEHMRYEDPTDGSFWALSEKKMQEEYGSTFVERYKELLGLLNPLPTPGSRTHTFTATKDSSKTETPHPPPAVESELVNEEEEQEESTPNADPVSVATSTQTEIEEDPQSEVDDGNGATLKELANDNVTDVFDQLLKARQMENQLDQWHVVQQEGNDELPVSVTSEQDDLETDINDNDSVNAGDNLDTTNINGELHNREELNGDHFHFEGDTYNITNQYFNTPPAEQQNGLTNESNGSASAAAPNGAETTESATDPVKFDDDTDQNASGSRSDQGTGEGIEGTGSGVNDTGGEVNGIGSNDTSATANGTDSGLNSTEQNPDGPANPAARAQQVGPTDPSTAIDARTPTESGANSTVDGEEGKISAGDNSTDSSKNGDERVNQDIVKAANGLTGSVEQLDRDITTTEKNQGNTAQTINYNVHYTINLQAAINQQGEELDGLRKQDNPDQNRIRELEESREAQQGRLDATRDQTDKLDSVIDGLRGEIAELKKRLDGVNSAGNRLDDLNKNEKAGSGGGIPNDEMNKLQEQLNRAQARCQDLENRLDQLNTNQQALNDNARIAADRIGEVIDAQDQIPDAGDGQSPASTAPESPDQPVSGEGGSTGSKSSGTASTQTEAGSGATSFGTTATGVGAGTQTGINGQVTAGTEGGPGSQGVDTQTDIPSAPPPPSILPSAGGGEQPQPTTGPIYDGQIPDPAGNIASAETPNPTASDPTTDPVQSPDSLNTEPVVPSTDDGFSIDGYTSRLNGVLNNHIEESRPLKERLDSDLFDNPNALSQYADAIKEQQNQNDSTINSLTGILRELNNDPAAGDGANSETVQQLREQLSENIETIRSNNNELAEKQKAYDTQHQIMDDLLGNIGNSGDTPDQVVDSAVRAMNTLISNNEHGLNEQWVSAAIGTAADKARSAVGERLQQELQNSDETDDAHEKFQQSLDALRRLAPENLPTTIKSSTSSEAYDYLSSSADRDRSELGQQLSSVSGGDSSSGTSASYESELLKNPEFSNRVATFLSTLQERHEGTDWNYDYASASLAGLESIRDEFELTKTPNMGQLLTAVAEDLDRTDSTVLAEVVKQHHHEYSAKDGTARREKVKTLTNDLLKKEQGLSGKQKMRGQTFTVSATEGREGTDGTIEITEHPHQAMIESLRSGSVQAKATAIRGEDVGVGNKLLEENHSGVLNSFFEGCSSQAIMTTNSNTKEHFVRLEGSKDRESQMEFKSSDGVHWQTELQGNTWTVDPSFLMNNPTLTIPFGKESDGNGRSTTDWLPVKSENGRTALLVANKGADTDTFMMYEAGSGGELKPVPILGGNPKEERIVAELMLKATSLNTDSPSANEPLNKNDEKMLSEKLPQINERWLSQPITLGQLRACYNEISANAASQGTQLFNTVPLAEQGSNITLTLPLAQQISAAKATEGREGDTGVKLESFGGGGSVNASYQNFNQTLYDAKLKLLNTDDNQQAGQHAGSIQDQQAQFSDQAFTGLQTFADCKLQGGDGEAAQRQDRKDVGTAFDKVLKNNQSHCMLAEQEKRSTESALVQQIRDNSGDKAAGYSDQDLLSNAIDNFEKGVVPQGLNAESYANNVAQLMLLDTDIQHSRSIQGQLQQQQDKLKQLGNEAVILTPDEYNQQLEQWNLETAGIATEQQQLRERLQSYGERTLDPTTRSEMAFERRHGQTLTDGQAKELGKAMDGINRWAAGEESATLSHNGMNDSALLQAMSEHACNQLGDKTDRSVVVMSPDKSMHKDLQGYFAGKGQEYQQLNVPERILKSGKNFSLGDAVAIENQLLGLPADTDVSKREGLLQQGRVPVGVSVADVQTLRAVRDTIGNDDESNRALRDKLDDCLDLLQNSMVFADQWDTAVVPDSNEEMKQVSDTVNGAVRLVRGGDSQLTADQVNQRHAEFLLGCKGRHMQSETMATPFAAALASDTGTLSELQESAGTDATTTNQRLWHLLSQAEPLYIDSAGDGYNQLMSDVVNRAGHEPQIVLFDSTNVDDDTGSARDSGASHMNDALNSARKDAGGVTKQLVYHNGDDNDKLLVNFENALGEKSKKKELSSGARYAPSDGYLNSLRTDRSDIPKSEKTVGVLNGLVGANGIQTNENLLARQMGQLTGTGNGLNNPPPLFVAVDMSSINNIKGMDTERNAFVAAKENLDNAKTNLSTILGGRSVSEELKKAIDKTVTVSAAGQGMSAQDAAQEVIKELKDKEWSQLGLSSDELDALQELKTAQWQAKQKWVSLLAASAAHGEKNGDSVACEQRLGQAQLNSHLDRVFADEHRWLNNDGANLVNEMKGVPDNTKKEVVDQLKQLQRRTHDGNASTATLRDLASTDAKKAELDKMFDGLRNNPEHAGHADNIRNALMEKFNELGDRLGKMTDDRLAKIEKQQDLTLEKLYRPDTAPTTQPQTTPVATATETRPGGGTTVLNGTRPSTGPTNRPTPSGPPAAPSPPPVPGGQRTAVGQRPPTAPKPNTNGPQPPTAPPLPPVNGQKTTGRSTPTRGPATPPPAKSRPDITQNEILDAKRRLKKTERAPADFPRPDEQQTPATPPTDRNSPPIKTSPDKTKAQPPTASPPIPNGQQTTGRTTSTRMPATPPPAEDRPNNEILNAIANLKKTNRPKPATGNRPPGETSPDTTKERRAGYKQGPLTQENRIETSLNEAEENEKAGDFRFHARGDFKTKRDLIDQFASTNIMPAGTAEPKYKQFTDDS